MKFGYYPPLVRFPVRAGFRALVLGRSARRLQRFPMKLLALTEGSDHVCHRYRVAAFAPALAARGWSVEAWPLSRNSLARAWQLQRVAAADVVLLQRRLLPFWQLSLLRRRAKKLIYDFDDAVFYRDSFAAKGHASWLRLGHFWATAHAADAVFAGNSFLAHEARHLVGQEKVVRLPTCVAPQRYPLAQHADGPVVRLVWIGQQSTLPCLQYARQRLAGALAPLPAASLRVICDREPALPGVPVELRPWSTATEAVDLAECDIGISFLPDDPWSQGKCGLKVLQYMAAGLPVVANAVGMNRQMVRDGENGFLVQTDAEWTAAIGRLAADPALRRAMGRAGRRIVEREYNADAWAAEFAESVQCVADGRPLESPAVGLPRGTPSMREWRHAV